jgi:hypothetical protein
LNGKLVKIIIVVWLSIAALASAYAAPATVMGAGTHSCGKWIEARSDAGSHYQYKQWLMGFISGINWRVTQKQAKPPDGEAVVAFVDLYCRNNPLHSLLLAPRMVSPSLDTWSIIEDGVAALSTTEASSSNGAVRWTKFPGFDGNNETEHFSACRFWIETLGRFGHFHGRDLNSHSESLPKYRMMLEKFLLLRPKLIPSRKLTRAELEDLLQ